jgi:hypothetical protein
MDFPIESASLSGWVENEVRESIWRDRNRTCVVQWELFNEITERQPHLKRLLHPMSVLARQLDPTRLILDESGGWAQGANAFASSEPTQFNDIHITPARRSTTEVYQKRLRPAVRPTKKCGPWGCGGGYPARTWCRG